MNLQYRWNFISLFGNMLFPMPKAEMALHLVQYFSTKYRNSRQNIIIWKDLVDIRSEAWLNLFGNTKIENCLQCVCLPTVFSLFNSLTTHHQNPPSSSQLGNKWKFSARKFLPSTKIYQQNIATNIHIMWIYFFFTLAASEPTHYYIILI